MRAGRAVGIDKERSFIYCTVHYNFRFRSEERSPVAKKRDIREAPEGRGESRRKAMIDAAYSLFIEKGYASVTVDDIIKVSGGSKSSLYKFFSSKEGILEEVVRSLGDQFLKEIKITVSSKRTPRESLSSIGSTIIKLALSENAINQQRLAVQNAKIFPELSKLWYDCGPKTTFDALADYLRKENEEGRLKIENPTRAALFFAGMLIFKDNMTMSIGADPPSRKEMEEIVADAVDVFLAAYET